MSRNVNLVFLFIFYFYVGIEKENISPTYGFYCGSCCNGSKHEVRTRKAEMQPTSRKVKKISFRLLYYHAVRYVFSLTQDHM